MNSKIGLGLVWAVIGIIYIAYRFAYFLDLRLIDWIGSGAMFIMGVLSIVEGVKISGNDTRQNSDSE